MAVFLKMNLWLSVVRGHCSHFCLKQNETLEPWFEVSSAVYLFMPSTTFDSIIYITSIIIGNTKYTLLENASSKACRLRTVAVGLYTVCCFIEIKIPVEQIWIDSKWHWMWQILMVCQCFCCLFVFCFILNPKEAVSTGWYYIWSQTNLFLCWS